MRTMTNKSTQKGAALIVGMILLMVLTLLAVAGMNTASMEFMMAGNNQYRSRAFQAAEAGIDQAYSNAPLVPTKGYSAVMANTFPSTDSYRAVVIPVVANVATQEPLNMNVPGSSSEQFKAWHFRIDSTGSAARGSSSTQTQELYVISTSVGAIPVVLPCAADPCAL
ncbi:MAG TPA: PilX N-terminal domain-containing pilus assembly protein [Steroidobacteraceae bacterium]|nr:PilX N-terminal domain-containing pilus assembly protein [Steroidobacteraceae bacterium]